MHVGKGVYNGNAEIKLLGTFIKSLSALTRILYMRAKSLYHRRM
jgi:hypothetical protein